MELEDQKIAIKELQEFYTDGKIANIDKTLEKLKDEQVKDMISYAIEHKMACKWDKDGVPIEFKVDYNPIVISNAYFKPIIPIRGNIPKYTSDKLGLLYDYYSEILAEINDKIGFMPPSISSFCKLAGITTRELRNYKNSDDYNMRIVVEKIYDEIGDNNLTLAQMGATKETSTLFRLKAQHDMVEKSNPNVNITIKDVVDTSRIDSNLDKYKRLLEKSEELCQEKRKKKKQ